ncbi:MAG: hypothetical protein JWL73_1206 [Actinomycetia bacterium]|nr:hypothetical protein [Actinomycetes bacterium]
MTPPADHVDPADRAASRSARGIEQQVLAEMAEEERDRNLDLPFAFVELLWSGAVITVRVTGHAFEGAVVHAGEDLVTLDTAAGSVDVHTGSVLSVLVLEPGAGPARAREQMDPRRFVARLREICDEGHAGTSIGAEHGARELRGRILRVHADHVVFVTDDGSQWLLPLRAIAYVRRGTPGPAAPKR